MAYFDCIVGGSGKGNTLVVTCADDLAGATITCTNGTKTYTKTCPSTAPYEVTFYGLEAGTWTISATVSGNTYTTTVVITDYEAALGGFNWKTWVDLSDNYTSSDFTDLDELLDTELAVRELMTIHACVDYLADIATTSEDVETIIGNDFAAKWINLRDYALDTLYANTIIADYMDTADKYFYGEWVITDNTTTPPTWAPKGNVPVMTSNTAPYGSAGGSSANTSYPHYKAFDGDDASYFETANAVATGHIYYGAVNPICVRRFHIINGSSTGGALKIRYSDDATNWTECDEAFTLNANGGGTAITDGKIADYGYHLYWDAYLTPTSSVKMRFKTLQFYGRELSVSVPVMSGNTTPYGEAKCSHAESGYDAYKAFDGNDSSSAWYYTSGTAGLTPTVEYDFVSPIEIVKMTAILGTGSSTSSSGKAKLQYYDISDNIWKDLTEELDYTSSNSHYYIDLPSSIHTDKVRYICVTPPLYGGQYLYGYVLTLQFYGLDYSEKEFEEGTTKKWLYDHGVELETMEIIRGSVTKNADNIRTAAANSTAATCGAMVDLTTYELLRQKIDYFEGANGNELMVLTSTTNLTKLGSAYITSSNAPYTIALDISSIDQTALVTIQSAYPSAQVAGIMETTELWLE